MKTHYIIQYVFFHYFLEIVGDQKAEGGITPPGLRPPLLIEGKVQRAQRTNLYRVAAGPAVRLESNS